MNPTFFGNDIQYCIRNIYHKRTFVKSNTKNQPRTGNSAYFTVEKSILRQSKFDEAKSSSPMVESTSYQLYAKYFNH